jgi:hypothetical protein
MSTSKKQGKVLAFKASVKKSNSEDDIDALFRQPLAEFTGARNALAVQLKKTGRGDEAVLVKALAKPPISAWTVNQLYWNHREEFDKLIASGGRFHKAQIAGQVSEMRTALDARRETLTELSDLATSLLEDAGHNPSLDTIRRITTTLEAISAYASHDDAPRPGRLTADVDPPGFELFSSMIGGFSPSIVKPARGTPAQKTSSVAAGIKRKGSPVDDARQLEELRKAKIAAARASLQDAKKALSQARTMTQRLEAAQKKADADAKDAEKRKRDAEASFEKAKAAAEEAAKRARSIAVDVKEAESALEDAEGAVEDASEELRLRMQE